MGTIVSIDSRKRGVIIGVKISKILMILISYHANFGFKSGYFNILNYQLVTVNADYLIKIQEIEEMLR